jgi:hypothetical protein
MPPKAKPGRPIIKITKVFSNGSKHTSTKCQPKKTVPKKTVPKKTKTKTITITKTVIITKTVK